MSTDPYTAQNCVAATDQIRRAAISTPHIPAVLREFNAQLAANETEIKDEAAGHALDLPRLIETFRQPRTPGAQIL